MTSLGDNNTGERLSRAVEGTVSLTAQLPNGKSLQMSGYILSGDRLGDINMKLDVMVAAIDRQRLIAEVPELETKLKQMHDALEQTDAILETLASAKKKTSVQENQEATHRKSREHIQREILRGEEAVAKAKAAAAQAAVV